MGGGKQQFLNKHRNLNISKTELERKWRVREQEEEMRLLWENAVQGQSKAMGSAGGGPTLDFLNNDYVEDYIDDYFG